MEERELRVGAASAGFAGAVYVHVCTPKRLHPPAFATGGGKGETRPVGTEDSAVMQCETEGRAMGTTVISQISAGRTNRLWLEADAAEESPAFDESAAQDHWVHVPARKPMEVAP